MPRPMMLMAKPISQRPTIHSARASRTDMPRAISPFQPAVINASIFVCMSYFSSRKTVSSNRKPQNNENDCCGRMLSQDSPAVGAGNRRHLADTRSFRQVKNNRKYLILRSTTSRSALSEKHTIDLQKPEGGRIAKTALYVPPLKFQAADLLHQRFQSRRALVQRNQRKLPF